MVRERRVWGEYLCMFSFCPPISCLCLPLTQPNWSLEIKEFSDLVHGSLFSDHKAGQRSVENRMEAGKRGLLTENNPHTSKDSGFSVLSHTHHSVLNVLECKIYSRAVIKHKQEKTKSMGYWYLCVFGCCF